MSLDPVLFDSVAYETANETFSFCMGFLEQKGLPTVADRLKGFEPVNTSSQGVAALRALRTVRPLVAGEAREYVDIAINAVKHALGTYELAHVA